MYLPSLPDIAHVLEAPTARVQLTISSYLIGFAVGQVIYGPLSDRHGRRPVLLAALVLYLASTLACAAVAIDRPADRGAIPPGHRRVGLDCAGARHRARSLFRRAGGARIVADGLDQRLCPIVAPMIGGVLQTAFGWRASFICHEPWRDCRRPRRRRGCCRRRCANAPAEPSSLFSMVARIRLGAAASRFSGLSRHHHHQLCRFVRLGIWCFRRAAKRLWPLGRDVRLQLSRWVRPATWRERRSRRGWWCGSGSIARSGSASSCLQSAAWRWRRPWPLEFPVYGWWPRWRSILPASGWPCRKRWPGH